MNSKSSFKLYCRPRLGSVNGANILCFLSSIPLLLPSTLLVSFLFKVRLASTGPMYFVFCRPCPFSPQPPWQCLGPTCHLSTLKFLLILYRRCRLAFPYDRKGFVGPKKKTIMGLVVFNPLW